MIKCSLTPGEHICSVLTADAVPELLNVGAAPADALHSPRHPHLPDRQRVQRPGRGHGEVHHRLLPFHAVRHVRGPRLHPAHPSVQRRIQPQQVLGDRNLSRTLRGVGHAGQRDQHVHFDHLPGQQRHGAEAGPRVPGVRRVRTELRHDG